MLTNLNPRSLQSNPLHLLCLLATHLGFQVSSELPCKIRIKLSIFSLLCSQFLATSIPQFCSLPAPNQLQVSVSPGFPSPLLFTSSCSASHDSSTKESQSFFYSVSSVFSHPWRIPSSPRRRDYISLLNPFLKDFCSSVFPACDKTFIFQIMSLPCSKFF